MHNVEGAFVTVRDKPRMTEARSSTDEWCGQQCIQQEALEEPEAPEARLEIPDAALTERVCKRKGCTNALDEVIDHSATYCSPACAEKCTGNSRGKGRGSPGPPLSELVGH